MKQELYKERIRNDIGMAEVKTAVADCGIFENQSKNQMANDRVFYGMCRQLRIHMSTLCICAEVACICIMQQMSPEQQVKYEPPA